MKDTQWPRFQVFVQGGAGEPHIDAGSIHAPDTEMALLNARDVFARRPTCVSMWVVPAEAIYMKTREELLNAEITVDDYGSTQGEQERYHVFCKLKHTGTQTLVGDVQAPSPEHALRRAIEAFSNEPSPLVWWLLPARMVTRSDPSETGSMYEPAKEKAFRMSTDFHTLTTMRQIERIKST
jgi:ring-1,2-phenylacetyl-CoA epoxidase subunit PaaB